MIINSHNLLPAAWAFLFNSDTKFYNTSPGVYAGRLLARGFNQQSFDTLFGHGYLNYREMFCVAKSQEHFLMMNGALQQLGFCAHDQHSFLDKVLVDLDCRIYRQDQYGIVVAIVQEYSNPTDNAEVNMRVPVVEVWELMEKRLMALIQLMVEELEKRHCLKKGTQAYMSNWLGSVSRAEFLRAQADIKAQMKLNNTKPKPAPRARKKVVK